MPKIVGFIGGDLTPAEPRSVWGATIMAGLASYALLWLASKSPGRSLVPNKRRSPPLAEYSAKVLMRIDDAAKAARAGERRNPVPPDAVVALATLPPGRFSFDTDRGRVRRYKAKTSMHGAMHSTSKAASESGHPHILVDTRGDHGDGSYLSAVPVVLRAYREDGEPTFMIEHDGDIVLAPPLPKEARVAKRIARAEARAARESSRAARVQTRAEKTATRDAERAEKAAQAAAQLVQMKADREAAAAERKEAKMQREEARAETIAAKPKTSRGIAGPPREISPAQTSMEPPAKTKTSKKKSSTGSLRMSEEVTPAMLKERRKVLRELAGQMTEAEALKKYEEKLAKSVVPAPAPAPASVKVGYLIGYLKGKARIIDVDGNYRLVDGAIFKAGGIEPKSMFVRHGRTSVATAPGDAKLTWSQEMALREARGMKTNAGEAGQRTSAVRDTGKRKMRGALEMAMIEWDYITPDLQPGVWRMWLPVDQLPLIMDESLRVMKINAPRWGTRAAGLLIVARDTGRLLLTLRSAAVTEPHTWGLPGGKCDGTEGARACALREFHEETGYGLPVVVASPPLHVFREPNFEFHNFLGFVEREFEPELDEENDSYGWFELNDLPRRLHFGVRELFGVAGRDIQSMVAQA